MKHPKHQTQPANKWETDFLSSPDRIKAKIKLDADQINFLSDELSDCAREGLYADAALIASAILNMAMDARDLARESYERGIK